MGTRRNASCQSSDALAPIPAVPPDLAVIETDGGRIPTRQPGHCPGVHLGGEGWRETKNAWFDPSWAEDLRQRPAAGPAGVLL